MEIGGSLIVKAQEAVERGGVRLVLGQQGKRGSGAPRSIHDAGCKSGGNGKAS